ncbi:MAG: DNA mismatch endonuclease Vsr [Desulfobacteraceae bacterium]|nr:DNA mismatch endonuclease Vsr [Desulfobacteraceae bacterium]
MTDIFSNDKRSWIMGRVKDKDTSPEKIIRSLAHKLGYRFRLHRKQLPGKPDLVFSSRKKVIFVHGCFWHGHDCRRGKRIPKTNTDYWVKKIQKNIARDSKNQTDLVSLGWDVLVIWECEISETETIVLKINKFLSN